MKEVNINVVGRLSKICILSCDRRTSEYPVKSISGLGSMCNTVFRLRTEDKAVIILEDKSVVTAGEARYQNKSSGESRHVKGIRQDSWDYSTRGVHVEQQITYAFSLNHRCIPQMNKDWLLKLLERLGLKPFSARAEMARASRVHEGLILGGFHKESRDVWGMGVEFGICCKKDMNSIFLILSMSIKIFGENRSKSCIHDARILIV